ncbi:MAG: alpha/beta hydrolase [Dehalococcoidia bacterium]
MDEVTIWSNGTRMKGDLYRPAGHLDGKLRPAIVCCHGWAHPLKHSLAETGFPQAMAAAGYFVLAFDYRGWGASDGVPFVAEELAGGATKSASPAAIIREVFDPLDWALDIRHAIDFIEGEAGVDRDRIGLAGWSLGGGMVVYVAANDARVKCVVGHAGAYDYRGEPSERNHFFPMWSEEQMHEAAIQRARGEREPGPVAIDLRDRPASAPAYRPEGQQAYRVNPDVRFFGPIAWADRVDVPVLVIDAEKEWIWDIREHGERLAAAIGEHGRAPAEYRVLPGLEHLDIYKPSSGATEIARGWFDKHLLKA